MKSICIYCSRTGRCEAAAKRIADKKGMELLRISDGKDRKGFFGYVGTLFQQLGGKLPELLPVKTQYPLSEYEKIVLIFPIWCEDVCMLAKSFLKTFGKELNGQVYFVAAHMSDMTYEKKIEALNGYGKKASGSFSVKSQNESFEKAVEEYVDGIF